MKFANRLKETTTSTSAATITLAGAVTGFRSLAKVISTGASDPNALKVGDTGVPFMVEDAAGNWEEGLYTITSSTVITRTSVLDSSNDGAAVTFPAGSKTVACTVPSQWLARIATLDEGMTDDQLPAAPSSIPDTWIGSVVTDPVTKSGYKATVAVLKALYGTGGNATTPADATAPSAPTSLASSNVAQTAATITWAASTDNVGVVAYEITKDGTSWTNVGNVLTYTYSALTAGTTYPVQVRAIDAAGNRSTVASLAVTTAAATQGGDATAPSMSGSIATSNVTDTGFTMSYSAGSDNVGVSRYEVSTDGGANWINNGTNLTYTATGKAASTLYNLRVRCFDAAGNVSNVLSGTVTTTAAVATAPGAPTIGAVTAGDSSASVNGTAPASNGGATITSYTSTAYKASDNTVINSVSGTTLPINHTGLANGVAVYFKLSASNSAGTGPQSAASATVTPATPVAYIITGYDNGSGVNAVNTSISGATGSSDPRYVTASSGAAGQFTKNIYWNIKTAGGVEPASAVAGWSDSSTVPPPILSALNQNDGTVGKNNGAVPLGHPAAWRVDGVLWVNVGHGGDGKFFWIKPVDGAWQCMNPKDVNGNFIPTVVAGV